jgi:hypothetical protein
MSLRGRKWWEAGDDFIIRIFIACDSSDLIRVIKSRKMIWAGDK